jgi:hypothetical protein
MIRAAAALAALSMLLFVQTASAADFYATTTPEITQRINQAVASSGSDTVHIAAGTYAIDSTTFPNTVSADDLHIVGAGVGQTVLTGTTSSNPLIYIGLPTTSSSFGGFTLQAQLDSMWQNAAVLARGTLHDFDISLTTDDLDRGTALYLAGGAPVPVAVRDGKVTVNGDSMALNSVTPYGLTIDRVELNHNGGDNSAAGFYVGNSNASDVYSHLTIRGFRFGYWQTRGTTRLEDSLIDMGDVQSATGLLVRDGDSSSDTNINFTGRRLTIVGDGLIQKGVEMGTNPGSGTDTTAWQLDDSVIYGTGSGFTSLTCAGAGATGSPGTIATNVAISAPTGGCTAGIANVLTLTGSPFFDFAAGDFRPRWNSQLVDAGATSAQLAVDGKDLAGGARVVDGDGDSSALVDLGAYEYQRQAPSVMLTPAKTQLTVSEATTFTADASDPEGENLTYAWKIDDAVSPFTGTVLSGGFVAAGTHTVSVTVTDEGGATATASAVVNVSSGEVACPAIPSGFTRAVRAKKAFSWKRKGFSVARSKQKQPYIAVTSTGVLKATITLKRGKKRLKGTQTLKLKKGVNKIVFGGKWGKKRLKKGTYIAVFAPVQSGSCPATEWKQVTLKLK